MATTRDLLSNVLRGLRKDAIDSASTELTNSYHLLALQFLNTAKRKIEAAWDWQALRTTVTVTLTQGTSEYALTAAGPADVDVGPLSRLLYERPTFTTSYTHESSVRMTGAQPQMFDVTDSGEYRLRESTWEALERAHFTDNDEQGIPERFALKRDASNLTLRVYPTPSEARTLKLRFVIPQTDLASDDLDATLTIPADEAVWLRALMVANEERGEELSRPVSLIEMDYHESLANSISFEQTDADATGYPE